MSTFNYPTFRIIDACLDEVDDAHFAAHHEGQGPGVPWRECRWCTFITNTRQAMEQLEMEPADD